MNSFYCKSIGFQISSMELNTSRDSTIGEIEECENVKSMLGKLARSSFAASFGVNDDVSAALAVTIILELILIIVTLIAKVFNLIFGSRGTI